MMIAVVRIRGGVKARKDVLKTLEMLKLRKINHCSVMKKSNSIVGMLHKVKDYVTWGEIDEKLLKRLIEKRDGDKLKDIKIEGIECFRLHPPIKGYKSVKKHWPKGDLGYRGKKIEELIKRMIM